MSRVGEPRTTPYQREPVLASVVLDVEWFFFNSKGYTAYGGILLHNREPPLNREPPCLRVVPDVLVVPGTHATRPPVTSHE